MKTVKRFIAGARCTKCQQMDKIRCWREGDLHKSECVSCGYSETMTDAGEKIESTQVLKLPTND